MCQKTCLFRTIVLFFDVLVAVAVVISELTLKEGRGKKTRQTLCDKRDSNFFLLQLFPKLHSPLNRSFCKRPENLNVCEDHDKTRK